MASVGISCTASPKTLDTGGVMRDCLWTFQQSGPDIVFPFSVSAKDCKSNIRINGSVNYQHFDFSVDEVNNIIKLPLPYKTLGWCDSQSIVQHPDEQGKSICPIHAACPLPEGTCITLPFSHPCETLHHPYSAHTQFSTDPQLTRFLIAVTVFIFFISICACAGKCLINKLWPPEGSVPAAAVSEVVVNEEPVNNRKQPKLKSALKARSRLRRGFSELDESEEGSDIELVDRE